MASLPRLVVPFIDDLGIEFLDAPPGEGRVCLQLQPRHLNSWRVAHGGVLMSMLDVAMAIAGRSLDAGARGGVTVEMKTSFLQPALEGSRLVASGRAFHRSTTMAFCEGEVRDSHDRLIAKAIGTFKTIKRPGRPGRSDDAATGLPRAGRGGGDAGRRVAAIKRRRS